MHSNCNQIVFALMAFITLPCAFEVHAQDNDEQIKTISTNLRGFTVPFKIANESGQFIEVQLYVSKDKGRNWSFYARQEVNASGFPFSCNEDGEYWFSLKTLDRNRRLIPAGRTIKPELSIIVDSKKPELEFFVESDAAGRIISSWKVTDEFIDINSMIVRHRGIAKQGTPEDWVQVDLGSSNQAATPKKLQDRIAWWPKSKTNRIEVELKISDMAGNENSVSRTITLPSYGSRSRNSSNSTTSQSRSGWTQRQVSGKPTTNNLVCKNGVCEVPVSNTPQLFRTPRSTSKLATNAPSTPVRQVGSPVEYVAPPVPSGFIPASNKGFVSVKKSNHAQPQSQTHELTEKDKRESISWESKSTRWTGQNQENQSSTIDFNEYPRKPAKKTELGIHTQRFQDVPVVNRSDSQEATAQNKVTQEGNWQISESSTLGKSRPTKDQPFTAPKNYTQAAGTLNTNQGSSSRRTKNVSYPRALPSESSISSSSTQKISVNSKRFNLNYGIKAIDSSGVGKVILWATEDGGNSWNSWSHDPDNASPFPVEVDDEGIYGFIVTINSKDGLVGKAPSSGDQPDIWVQVDLQTPKVAITSAPYGTGQDVGKLVIHWDATDSYLISQPIDLYYSPNAQGPWTTIAKRLRNSGSYAWKVPKNVPEEIFLRIDARDQAGNVGIFQLTAPLSIAGLIPRGQIYGVEPVR